MNPPPIDPNPAPSEEPSNLAEVPDEGVKEAAEFVASTPKTLPLKRDVPPLFVPAVLPEATKEAPNIDAPMAEAPAAPASPDSGPAVSEPETALPTVEFSLSPDIPYSASLTLELRCALPEASIHYALDAEDVSEKDPIYNPAEKIFLRQSTTVAARAFLSEKDGSLLSGPLLVGRFEVAKPNWQKLEPTDQNDPTTHEASDEAILEGPWRLAAASVRGRLHAHRGGWREDAFRHGTAHAADGTYSIVVVSDGAGSAPLSRVASNLACQVALDYLCFALVESAPLADESKTLVERDLPSLRAHLVESARLALQKVREEASSRNRPLSDFSATLLILVRREWNGQQLCAALQAGDGGIALWNDDQTLTLLGEADHGEQSGETRFLTSNGMESEFPARVKFSIRPNLRAVAVMTDGVADDFFPETERFPELFKTVLALVEKVPAGPALLDWIDYEKKGSSDDRTLVLCWRAIAPDTGNAGEGHDQL